MVDVEGRVAWRREEIRAGVTADGVVDASVGTDLDRVRHTFREEAILFDVWLGQQACGKSVQQQLTTRLDVHTQNGRVVSISGVHRRSEIALEVTWVVAQPTIWTRFRAENASDRAQVDSHVGKRSSRHVAATHSSRKGDVVATNRRGRGDDRAVVRDIVAVAAETGVTAVEDGGVLRS